MRVEKLDVRVGGQIEFVYEEVGAVRNPEWRKELQAKGLSASWEARGTFLEAHRPSRLSFRQALDFGPEAPPQDYLMVARFYAGGNGTRIVLAAEAPPTKHWLLLGRQNLAGQLDRLTRVLAVG